jgi:lysosomal alpha-mannosidase
MMIDNIYWSPEYLDFQGDWINDGPFIDAPNNTENNAAFRAAQFVAKASEAANHFRTNHILFPIGGDFEYINAHLQFKNADRLINYINTNYPNITLLYSTPG